jgi:hypothetical protein
MRLPISSLVILASTSIIASSPAHAAEVIFSFSTSPGGILIGGPAAGNGTLTTDGVIFDSRGFTAQTITGITGTFNGSAITQLASVFGSNNLFYVTGPSFLDGSGLGFRTAAETGVNLFFQDSASSFRVNTVSPFTSSFATASSSAVATAVPEPTTWAMMMIGFGTIGYSMRRRKVGYSQMRSQAV